MTYLSRCLRQVCNDVSQPEICQLPLLTKGQVESLVASMFLWIRTAVVMTCSTLTNFSYKSVVGDVPPAVMQ